MKSLSHTCIASRWAPNQFGSKAPDYTSLPFCSLILSNTRVFSSLLQILFYTNGSDRHLVFSECPWLHPARRYNALCQARGSFVHQTKVPSSDHGKKDRKLWHALPLSPTAILNLGPLDVVDVSEATRHFCPFVCNLPWGCYSVECLPWLLLCSGYGWGPGDTQQGTNHRRCLKPGPYS